MDYNNKTNEEIHAEINNGLINGQKAIEKIKAKKTKSTNDNMMIDNMENMIRAYIALASKTFSSKYTTLEDIQIDLDSKIAQQKAQDKEKTSDTNQNEFKEGEGGEEEIVESDEEEVKGDNQSNKEDTEDVSEED